MSKSAEPHTEKICDTASLEKGIEALCRVDKGMARIVGQLQDVPLRYRAPGFEGLAEIIVSQQVSKASAAAIFGRLKASISPFHAASFLRAGEAVWIAAGLSRAKQQTLDLLAQAICRGKLDLERLTTIPASEAMQILVSHKGVGPWTAEVFLMFCAGHPNIFPAGDVALQHAVANILGHDAKPSTQETYGLAARWSPYQSIAARILYAHYAVMKGRSVLPV